MTEKWLKALKKSRGWLLRRRLGDMVGADPTYRNALQNNYAAEKRMTFRAIMEMTPMDEVFTNYPDSEDFDGSYPYDEEEDEEI